MKKIDIYGIPNCDVTKKAMSWLKQHKIETVFHDYKVEGVTKAKLEEWCRKAGWEVLLNKRSTTWRGLPSAEQAAVTNEAAAIRTMLENNSIIKRPVIESGNQLLVGFNETNYSTHLK